MKRFLLLLSVLTLSAGLALGLASCGGSSEDNGGSAGTDAASPAAQAECFLQAVKEKDDETIRAVYAGETFNPLPSGRPDSEDEYAALYDLLEEKVLDFDYEVSGETMEGDTAAVDVEITTYKIGKALTSFLKDLILKAFTMDEDITDAEIEEMILDMLSTELEGLEKKDYSETVTLSLSQQDGVWMVDALAEDDDLYDALTGGSGDFSQELETLNF